MTAKSLPPPVVEALPPLPPVWGWRTLFAAVGLCGLAAGLGLAIDLSALSGQPAEIAEQLKWASGQAGPHSQPGSPGELRRLHYEIGKTTSFSTVRIALVAVGTLAAAGGLAMLRGPWKGWLLAAGVWLLGGFGLPMHWDSIKLVLFVAGTAAAAGGGLAYLPPAWRYSLLVPAVLFHFLGTLTATTWPSTNGRTAWLSNQAALRVYLPYFRFMYLSNAYHFYSPDPGPASKFCVLIEYEIDDPEAANGKRSSAEWVDIPKRRLNYRDPLGLTYYRRLSLTELASYSTPGTMIPPTWERDDVVSRRLENQAGVGKQVAVPGATPTLAGVDLNQYRQPETPTRRAVFPTYARHIAAEYTRPRRTADGRELMHRVVGLKMFRLEHRIIEAREFLEYDNPEMVRDRTRNLNANKKLPTKHEPVSPYHQAMYAPYYLGEYAPDGTLKDPNDPLLFWLTPVVYTPPAGKDEPSYIDWMSRYAGREFPWEGKE